MQSCQPGIPWIYLLGTFSIGLDIGIVLAKNELVGGMNSRSKAELMQVLLGMTQYTAGCAAAILECTSLLLCPTSTVSWKRPVSVSIDDNTF